jgi:hypothetical protein
MFASTACDLRSQIPDCPLGPWSFKAELREGHKVTSCNQIHYLTAEEIRTLITARRERMAANVRAPRTLFPGDILVACFSGAP